MPSPPHRAPRGRLLLRSSLGLALVVALATGCAQKPSMTVRHAEVSGMQVGFPPQVGVVMTVVLDVYNPNSYDVAVRAVRGNVVFMEKWTLPVDFKPGGEGVWLAAKASTPVRVPTTVPVELALTLVRAAYTSSTVPFRVTGKADVTATRSLKIESDDWSVDEKGELSRQQIEASIPATLLGGFGGGAPAPAR